MPTGVHARAAGPVPLDGAVPGDAVVRAFVRYLERTLAEAGAGPLQVLERGLALPSPRAAVAVCVGDRSTTWYQAARWRSGLRTAFRGAAGRATGPSARRLPLAVLDRWDPSQVGPTPADFDVLALVATFNEEDVIEDLLARLRSDAVRVHVLDNWSTDSTFGAVRRAAGRDAGVTFERFPADGPPEHFELERLLVRVEELAHASGADWVVNHDADEVRGSPWPGVSLRRGLYCVERFGFNCVDHTLMNFRPTDESWLPGRRLTDSFSWFEFGDHHAAFRHQKAWKPQAEPVRFASTGGHDTEFAGRRVFPYRFLLRHYPIRSSAHGRRKVLRERQGRWSPAEREKGWHVHYDGYTESSSFLWSPESLHRFTTLEELDRTLLVERLSAAALPANPFPGESVGDDAAETGPSGSGAQRRTTRSVALARVPDRARGAARGLLDAARRERRIP